MLDKEKEPYTERDEPLPEFSWMKNWGKARKNEPTDSQIELQVFNNIFIFNNAMILSRIINLQVTLLKLMIFMWMMKTKVLMKILLKDNLILKMVIFFIKTVIFTFNLFCNNFKNIQL